ncbi:hypothetical protein C2E23DRAFT_443001 [Lenzites betulinus]|nr:hypothetical protein C2E23DRAFT_443001 [Lenzites betulinus]
MLGGNGGRGHMSNQKVAGFDPFFFIHHAQTDRLVSLWAALHPDQWVTASHEPQGSWMLENTAEVNEMTGIPVQRPSIHADMLTFSSIPALAPFYCTENGQYWTSADLHVPTDGLFGYSYPDFNDVKDWGDTAAVQALVKSNIEKMYPFKDVIMQHIAFDAGASLPLCPPIPGIAAPTRAVLDWVAHITVKKNALGCGFVVFVFLGDAPADPEHYNRSANLIGDFCAFVNETPEMCANCVRLGNVTIGGAVDLSDALIERGAVANLHPDEVVPYLRRELRWRVWTGTGPSVHPSDVEELEIDVSATPHYLDEDGEVQVGEPVLYHEVTRSMPEGCRHSSQLVDVA